MKTRHVILALAVLVGWLPAFAQAQAPVITRQPTNQVAALGSFGNASFSAMATGLFTPSFQWWVNGHPAKEGGSSGSGGGIIETTLAFYNVIWQDAGDYTVVFSNALGTVTSVVATLSINPQAPAITIQPTNQSAFLTDDVVFRAAALGFPPPAYQWRFNGVDLSGETNGLLSVLQADATHAGAYTVVASNGVGAVTSLVATLTLARRGPLDDWRWRNPLPQGDHLRGVTCANGRFIAVGLSGSMVTSTNGVNWARIAMDPGISLWSVAYGNGVFVAVGGTRFPVGTAGVILSSVDGVRWVRRDAGRADYLNGVAYGNGMFVAVGQAFATPDTILTSTDGVTWAARATGPSTYLRSIAFGNGRFIAVGSGGAVMRSTNGLVWELYASGAPGELYGVSYGNGTFVAVGLYNALLTSTDNGTTWINRNSGPIRYVFLYGVTYGNGAFMAVGYDVEKPYGPGPVFTSPNGITWTERTTSISALHGVAAGAGTFVAVSDCGAIATSPTGGAWTRRTLGPASSLNGVAIGSQAAVAVGDDGIILSSPDGTQWTSRISGTTNPLRAVAFGTTNFVAVGDRGAVVTSVDGAAWTARNVGTNFQMLALTFGNGTYVAVGGRSNPFDGPPPIFTSTNGVNWTSRTSSLTSTLTGIAYGKGKFVAVDGRGGFARSTNGISWTNGAEVFGVPIHPNGPQTLFGIAFGNGIFVALHFNSEYDPVTASILSSTDGYTWYARYMQPYGYLYAVAYGDGVFTAVGEPDYTFAVTSTDGDTWTRHSPSTSSYLYAIGYGKDSFLAVGSGGTILQSQPLPPILSGRPLPGGGAFEVTVSGGVERPHRLQATTDLRTGDWTDLLAFTNTAPATSFPDISTPLPPRRFYRAISP